MDPLRYHREAAELTREATVTRAGCSLASLQQLELGARPRKSAVLRRIVAVLAAELDRDYHELLDEIEGSRNDIERPAEAPDAKEATVHAGRAHYSD